MKYFKTNYKNNAALLALALMISACGGPKEGVDFGNLKEGDTVSSPFKVEFLVHGKTIKPAGENVKGTGHHHIIIDGGSIQAGKVVPMNDTHLHFGKGQTEATLELSPGKHSLTLQFADYAHRSFGSKWSKTITVIVDGR